MTKTIDQNNVRNITLRSIINDAMTQNNVNVDDKRVRAKLRTMAIFANIHQYKQSWTFTRNEYDVVRCLFDVKYREQCAKRDASKTTTRAKTTRAKTTNVVVDANASIDDTK